LVETYAVIGVGVFRDLEHIGRSQPTLAHDTLVKLIHGLYLIFKFTVMLWQSPDHDIRFAWHVQGNRAYKKQPLADLEFVLRHSRLTLHKEIRPRDRPRVLDAMPTILAD
jgi:hypothetical protein